MSLIPYQPHEGREIVLRHHNAIVVRDSTSHRLEIRGISECPTCHQPLTGRPSTSPDGPFDRSSGARHDTYVDPDYFRMLRAANTETTPDHPPPSPVRRIIKPALIDPGGSRVSFTPPPAEIEDDEDAEFVSSTPGIAPATGSRIRRDAFSPGYFNTFFVEERVLGKGGKGVVLLVRHEIDGCALGQFACKRVPVGDDHAWLEKVLVEVELLAKLSHPNLVSYRHVWLEDVQLTRFGPSVACAFILQQYCNGGDLHQYLVGSAPREVTKEELKAQMRRRSKGQMEPPADLFSGNIQLSFDKIYTLFKDITSGVAYLHAANYIHRDLKPSNCLLHQEGGKLICLISDFGEVQPENAVRKSSGTTGTISYCAPEVLRTDASGRYGNFTTKSDMFSLGMILYFMCFGRLPYQSANAIQEELEDVDELRAEITRWQGFQDERRLRPDLPSKLYQLLKKLLSLNPAERPSANEVLRAMRGESNFDSSTREEQTPNPSLSLNGSRVQNLDSPAVPSTPVPASRQRSPPNPSDKFQALEPWSRHSQREQSQSASGRNVYRDPSRSAGPRHRATNSMVISRSQDGFRSPPPAIDAPLQPQETAGGSFSPPLLMPPSASPPSVLHTNLVTFSRHLMITMGPHLPTLSYISRLGLFIVKVTSLTRPCWPYIVNSQVGIPLVAVAALDLGMPQLASFMPITGMSPRPLHSGGTRAWGIWTSLILFALHFIAIWLASERNALCVTPSHEELEYW